MIDVVRSRTGSSRLVSGPEVLKALVEAVDGAFAKLPWQFQAGDLATDVVRVFCELASECPRAYVAKRLSAVVPTAEAAQRVLDAVIAEGGPFARAEAGKYVRGDIAYSHADDNVTFFTVDETVVVDERVGAVFDALPRRGDAKEIRARLLDRLSDFDTEQPVELVADTLFDSFVGAGLLRAQPRLLQIDPRAHVYFTVRDRAIGGDSTDWVDECLESVLGRLSEETFAPVMHLIAPAPVREDDARRLVGEIVRLRNHRFTDASAVLMVGDSATLPSSEGVDCLRRVARSLECRFTLMASSAPARGHDLASVAGRIGAVAAWPVTTHAEARSAARECARAPARFSYGSVHPIVTAHGLGAARRPRDAERVAAELAAVRCAARRSILVHTHGVADACPLELVDGAHASSKPTREEDVALLLDVIHESSVELSDGELDGALWYTSCCL